MQNIAGIDQPAVTSEGGTQARAIARTIGATNIYPVGDKEAVVVVTRIDVAVLAVATAREIGAEAALAAIDRDVFVCFFGAIIIAHFE